MLERKQSTTPSSVPRSLTLALDRHTDTYIIPPGCEEEHLFDTELGRKCLEHHHIKSAGLSELQCPYLVARTSAQEHVVLFTRAGEGILELADRSYALQVGSMCILPAGLSYSYRTPSTWITTWFHLDTSPQWRPVTGNFRLRSSHNPEDLTAVNRLFLYERSRTDAGSYQLLDLYSEVLALLVMREMRDEEASAEPAYWPRIKAFREALYNKPGDEWSVEGIAKTFGFSNRKLQSLIHQLYNCGVMELVTKVRLEKAAYLLRTTNWKLEEISTRVGYQNSFAFSRVFKRHFGLSPKFYRAKQ